ncbi:MAG: Protein-glutamine gamma-glutamyltransferase [Lentisphaerae bacterium ADurb.Bin082]|nr:MAG: Protein-glutamine gamma-glutamyltransferase [Lentisphaerae bacterium ADurb.Bin082]
MSADKTSSVPRLDLVSRLLLSAMLLLAAAVFTVSGDAWHVGLLTLATVLGSALVPPFDFSTRSFVYVGLIVLVVLTFLDQAAPVQWVRFFFMPSHLLCPSLLLGGAAGLYFRRHEAVIAWVIGCALMALFLAGFVVDLPKGLPRLGLDGAQLWVCQHFWVYYAMAVVLSVAALLPILAGRSRQPRLTAANRNWRRYAWIGVAFILALACMQVMTVLMKSQEKQMRKWFMTIFQLDFPRPQPQGGVELADQINLRHPSPLLRDDDRAVVLRVKAAEIPGYLRTRVFTTYHDGQWEKNTSRSRSLSQTAAEGELAFTIFSRTFSDPDDEAAAERLEIYPAGRIGVLPAPGDAAHFEMFAERVEESQDGALEPSEWRTQAGCIVIRPGRTLDSAFAGPTGEAVSEEYLDVPADISPALDGCLAALLGPDYQPSDARLTMAMIVRYFQENFEYDLHTQSVPAEVDPVLAFLDGPRRGHCELFASATVLLLRRAGIPARYVTGFLCHERLRFGGYWVSRLRDAHAWVEAYDRDRNRWVLVESTPGTNAGEEPAQSGVNPFSALWDSLAFHWQRLNAMLRRGHVAALIWVGLGVMATLLEWLFLNPWLAPIVWPLTLWLLWRWTRRRWRRRRQDGLTGQRAILSQTYAEICRCLARLGVDLNPAMTPAELAASCRNKGMTAWAELLEDFSRMRYAIAEPEASETEAFRSRARALQK